MTTVISGNKVEFQNSTGKSDISLFHVDSGYQLRFDSEVHFNKPTLSKKIKVGQYVLQIENDILVIQKNGKTCFKLE